MKKLVVALGVLVLAGAGAAGYYVSVRPARPALEAPQSPPLHPQPTPSTNYKVTIYLPDPESREGLLVPLTRTVPEPPTPAIALELLLKGPQAEERASAIFPEGTRVLGAEVKGGVATVNLSKEFREHFPAGTMAATVTLYCIVNTLTELPEVRAVRLQVEGKDLKTLGEMDVSQPLIRDEGLIERTRR